MKKNLKRDNTRKWRQEWHFPTQRCLVSDQKNRGHEF